MKPGVIMMSSGPQSALPTATASSVIVYIIRRLMQAALVMVVMSALVFAGIYLIGDPVDDDDQPRRQPESSARPCAPRSSRPADVAAVPGVRGDAMHGNFGKSFLAGQPAWG